MIGFLRGHLHAKSASHLIIDVNGVGYRVTIPVSTFFEIGDIGGKVELFIHTHVREDALALFGFATEVEQQMFEKLITITGIGPRMAVTILSGLPAVDLSMAIRSGDVRRLTSVPGLGKKTADRLILELKDKLEGIGDPVPTRQVRRENTDREDAISALVNLGYRQRDAELALDKVPRDAGSLEQVLKAALGVLAR